MNSRILSSRGIFFFLLLISFVLVKINWGFSQVFGKLIILIILIIGTVNTSMDLVKKIKQKTPPLELMGKGIVLLLMTGLVIIYIIPLLGLDARFSKLPSAINRKKIENQMVAFNTLTDPGDKLFQAFGDAVDKRRIVALGESQHLTSEYSLLKFPLVRYLHEEKGFDVLFFESPTASVQSGIHKMGLDQKSHSGLKGIYQVWQTSENLPLFEYIIETQSTDHPLRVVGFDPQHYSSAWPEAREFLEIVMKRIAPGSNNDASMKQDGWTEIMTKNNKFESSDPRVVQGIEYYTTLAERLRKEIQAKKETNPDRILDLVLAEMVAEGIGVSLKAQTLESPERFYFRDRSMAKNIISLADGVFSDSRIIIWAHNTHICREIDEVIPLKRDFNSLIRLLKPSVPLAINTGTILADYFKEDFFALALLTKSGRMGNFTSYEGWFPVLSPRGDSVESLFPSNGERGVFLDIDKNKSLFSGSPIFFRTGGVKWNKADISEQFDGLVIVDKVSPPDRLTSIDFVE